MEALTKKELVLAARAMSQEEFNQLVLAQSERGAVMTDEGIIANINDGGGDNGLADKNSDVSNIGVHSLDFGEDVGSA
jgi:hypothetical protein